MRRTMDAEAINAIANDPHVLPWLKLAPGSGRADLAPLVLNPENVTLISDCGRGAYILHKISPCLYVAHSLALKWARGAVMQKLMQEGFAYMYTKTDAIEIQTICPDENLPALKWAHIAGFRKMFYSQGASFMTQNYMDWVVRDGLNKNLGGGFHESFETRAAGAVNHEVDPIHDYWVGATIRCAQAGNLHKGVQLYNRWAALTGYAPLSILSHAPPLVEMGGDIVGLSERGVEFLHIRNRVPSPPPEGLSNNETELSSQSCRPESDLQPQRALQ